MNRVLGGLIALGLFPSIAGQAQAEYTFSRLAVPGSPSSGGTVAFGINDAGQIVGDYIDAGGTFRGFLLSGGVYTPIDMPGAIATLPLGINDAGQIVGQYPTGSGSGGFLLSGGVYTPIAVPGAIAATARGINASGQIVGDYIAADRSGGFLATPVPEPSTLTLALFGIGSLGLLGYARRARPDGPATPGAGARPPARVQTPPGDKGGVRL